LIPLAFILAVVLFLGVAALVPERLPRAARLTVIVAAPVTATGIWFAVQAYAGWPLAAHRPPVGAAFVAADVQQPQWIYLWLRPRSSSRPRAYRVRYTDALYAQVLKAQQLTKHGRMIRVQRPQGGRRTAVAGRRRATTPPFELRPYREPPVKLPRKTLPRQS
jgi:hypothetical protein